MLINGQTLKAIFINLKTTFNNAFAAAPSTWAKIAMEVPSTGKQNDYAWLSVFPRMKKWIGEKDIKSLAAAKYSIVNDDWEATVEVDRNDIEDDNLGIYKPQAEMAGFSAKQLPDEIVYDVVNRGFTTLCHDGQYFFDTDHDGKDGSVSNRGTTALACDTLAKARSSYGAARTAMRKFKDSEGRPWASVPTSCWCRLPWKTRPIC
jgi:phage major head subunit gpT-like protein